MVTKPNPEASTLAWYTYGFRLGRAERDAEVLSLLETERHEYEPGREAYEVLTDALALIEEGSPSSPRLTVAAIAAHLRAEIAAMQTEFAAATDPDVSSLLDDRIVFGEELLAWLEQT